jgi:hypothetical protein
MFPGITKRWRWPVPGPAAATGWEAEKLDSVREIREQIKACLQDPPKETINFETLFEG